MLPYYSGDSKFFFPTLAHFFQQIDLSLLWRRLFFPPRSLLQSFVCRIFCQIFICIIYKYRWLLRNKRDRLTINMTCNHFFLSKLSNGTTNFIFVCILLRKIVSNKVTKNKKCINCCRVNRRNLNECSNY